MTRVRMAEAGDLPAVAAIWNHVIRHTEQTFTTAEKTVEGLRGLDPILVGEIDGRVVGFATYFPFRSGPGYRYSMEHSVYIDPAAHGHGLGRQLMQALEDHARDAGVHALMAGISGANPGGVTFHEKIGFKVVARLPEVGFKNGRYLDLVLAQKILS